MTAFPAIRIEGGLLGPDVLDQLLAAELPGQRPADFGLGGKRSLTDEIAAAFADARALWGVFQHRLERLRDDDPATSVTRDSWMVPFFTLLGYEPRFNARAHEIDGLTFAVSHRAGEAEDSPPLHILGAGQSLGQVPKSGRPRLAAHSLVQEYLNRTEHVWGVATNGRILRLLRDSTFVRRQAYIEFDLQAMLDEQRFQDFAALYRLLHRTRLPRGMADAGDCLLEQYHSHSVEQGGRVRDRLRDGVEECLKHLGNGFLRHRTNDDLRRRAAPDCTANDRITEDEFYRQLLRLVYRFLFLLVSEDRGLISADPIYREHYGVARLRRLLDRLLTDADYDDLWQSLRVLWRALGDDKFGGFLQLAPLNGELFAPQDLDHCTIGNRDLLDALWHLTWYQEKSAPPRRVNYAALDVEELGSVYESLLEFHPRVDRDAASRLTFDLLFGSERKTTGSYYTPPQLVAELIRSALEPVVRDRLAASPNEGEKALLSIRICDPACGSGHFLLAAARRLGKELARVRSGEDEPAPEHVRAATRDVIAHCIYGVDKNPLAVDLCRVALWLEGHTAGKPLTFLDHRIRPGDSLVGVFDLGVLKDGIPDRAFDPLAGDDKTAARELARRNRDERAGQLGLLDWEPTTAIAEAARTSRELDAIANDSPAAIARKKKLFTESHADPAWRRRHEACDLWTAAFFQPLKADTPAITTDTVLSHLARGGAHPRLLGLAGDLAGSQPFFHWPLEFPEVFADGGFDAILSNPPWEHVELKEQEFFAAYDAGIAKAPTKAARTKLIMDLPDINPTLYAKYIQALRGLDASRLFLATSGRNPLTGRGRINTYAVFAELNRELIRKGGRCGIIVQSDIATSDTCKFFFQDLIDRNALISFHDFVNTEGIFPAIHRTHPHFCLLTMSGAPNHTPPVFSFWNTNTGHLKDQNKSFTLTAAEIALLNPNTGNCPIFRTPADAELSKAIYRRVPVLWREAQENRPEENPWRLRFLQGLFNMSSDSHHFRTRAELTADGYRREGNLFVSAYDRYLPLYEAKMLHQFDHRWATYDDIGESREVTAPEKRDPVFVVQPRYWVREELVESAIPKYPEPLASALQADHRPSIQYVLTLWAAGFYINRNDRAAAAKLLADASIDLDRTVARSLGALPSVDDFAAALARDFPLTEADVEAIAARLSTPEDLARELVDRFSPKWFLGWRDVTNSTNERTLIASAVPRTAAGHTLPLAFCPGIAPQLLTALLANLDSIVTDYVARQKVGGTHITYNLLKQFPIHTPERWAANFFAASGIDGLHWFMPRVLELAYTTNDMRPLGRDCGYQSAPFDWDEVRRFEIRCELDAAFFHLYLPSGSDGDWRPADNETPEQLAALTRHFRKPRDAVGYILDQFPILRDKDEHKYEGRYRTKERVLEIYDAMLVAQRSSKPYRTSLTPPPGTLADT